MRQQEECICRQCGFLMTWLTSAIYANHILICSEESIIVGTVEGINCKFFILIIVLSALGAVIRLIMSQGTEMKESDYVTRVCVTKKP